MCGLEKGAFMVSPHASVPPPGDHGTNTTSDPSSTQMALHVSRLVPGPALLDP